MHAIGNCSQYGYFLVHLGRCHGCHADVRFAPTSAGGTRNVRQVLAVFLLEVPHLGRAWPSLGLNVRFVPPE
jgi:hypothetical protein